MRKLIAGTVLLLAAAAAFTIAGPLTPPAGPVASTYKTLSEVEPRTACPRLRGSRTGWSGRDEDVVMRIDFAA